MHSNSRTYRLLQSLEKSAPDPFDLDRMPSSTELLVHRIIRPEIAVQPKRRRGRGLPVKVSRRRQKAVKAVRSAKAVRM